jgi:hypothetical protein
MAQDSLAKRTPTKRAGTAGWKLRMSVSSTMWGGWAAGRSFMATSREKGFAAHALPAVARRHVRRR